MHAKQGADMITSVGRRVPGLSDNSQPGSQYPTLRVVLGDICRSRTDSPGSNVGH